MPDLVIVVPSLFPGLWWSPLAPLEPSKAEAQMSTFTDVRVFSTWQHLEGGLRRSVVMPVDWCTLKCPLQPKV